MFNPEKLPTAPETKAEDRIEKAKTFETWQKLVVGKGKELGIKIEDLNNEQFKELLYKRVEERLDETVEKLGVKVDEILVEKMNQTEDNKEKTKMQREIIKSVVDQLHSTPSDASWAFFPKEIEKEKKLNCSGAALLCGHILNKAGIKTEYGKPESHAINFAELADGTIEYVDARNNVIEDIEIKEEEFEGVKIRKINHKNIEYKLIPSVPQKDSISSILENLEALKGEAKKKDGNPVAKEIYENNKSLLDAANYEKLLEKLYPDLAKFEQTKEWKYEKKRIEDIRAFGKNMEKIRERFEDLSPETQEELKQEIRGQKDLIRDFLTDKEAEIEGVSETLSDFFTQTKEQLVPLKNWNPEDYNEFVENLVRKF